MKKSTIFIQKFHFFCKTLFVSMFWGLERNLLHIILKALPNNLTLLKTK